MKRMTMAEAFGRAILEAYNEELPDAERLPDWDATTSPRTDRSIRDENNRGGQ
jgi:hypothetical protein